MSGIGLGGGYSGLCSDVLGLCLDIPLLRIILEKSTSRLTKGACSITMPYYVRDIMSYLSSSRFLTHFGYVSVPSRLLPLKSALPKILGKTRTVLAAAGYSTPLPKTLATGTLDYLHRISNC